jgi:hypothetical protein
MVVIRYLFVLLLGALAGAAGVMFALQRGYGDVVLKNAPTVADLERRLDEMEQERNRLGRQLESVEARAGKMEKLFSDLEARFRGLSSGGEREPGASAAAGSGGAAAPTADAGGPGTTVTGAPGDTVAPPDTARDPGATPPPVVEPGPRGDASNAAAAP